MLDSVIVRSPAVFTVDTKGNRVFSEAEDGFRPGSKVRVSLGGGFVERQDLHNKQRPH